MRNRLIVLVAQVLLVSAETTAQTANLARFVGKDLRKLSTAQTQPLYKALREPEPDESTLDTTFPWYFWRTASLGQPRYILMRGKGLARSPTIPMPASRYTTPR